MRVHKGSIPIFPNSGGVSPIQAATIDFLVILDTIIVALEPMKN
jgi:hypothetical protein